MTNLWKRSLLGLALIGTLGSGMAMAQAPVADAPGPAVSAPHQHGGGWAQLNLTPDQQQRIRQIREGFAVQRKADMAAFEQQAKLVLNQDQFAKLQQIKQDRREEWQAHKGQHKQHLAQNGEHRRHHGHNGMQRLAKELNLTQEQKAQLMAYRESQAPHFKEERQAMREQIRSVLTPAQQQQLDQMRHQHRG